MGTTTRDDWPYGVVLVNHMAERKTFADYDREVELLSRRDTGRGAAAQERLIRKLQRMELLIDQWWNKSPVARSEDAEEILWELVRIRRGIK